MSLIKTWAPYFRSSIRMRGREYQLQGRVEQLPPQAGELVRAQVTGHQPYLVTIQGQGASTTVHCTCPFFAEGNYCKHIWATLLDVQSRGGIEPTVADAQQQTQDHHPLENLTPTLPKARRRDPARKPAAPREPEWIGRLSMLRLPMLGDEPASPLDAPRVSPTPELRQLCYLVDVQSTVQHDSLVIELCYRQPIRSGWSPMRRCKLDRRAIDELPDAVDRQLCSLMIGSQTLGSLDWDVPRSAERAQSSFILPPGSWRLLLEKMIATGRCFLQPSEEDSGSLGTPGTPIPLQWDGGQSWVLWLVGQDTGEELSLNLELRREEQRLPVTAPCLLLGGPEGILIHQNTVALLDDRDAIRWVDQFRDMRRIHHTESPSIRVPAGDIPRFLDHLYRLAQLPEIDLPPGVGLREIHVQPRPHLELFSPGATASAIGAAVPRNLLTARVWINYDNHRIRPGQPGRFIAQAPPLENPPQENQTPPSNPEPQTSDETLVTEEPAVSEFLIRRNPRLEEEAVADLIALGFRPDPTMGNHQHIGGVLAVKRMPQVVAHLVQKGWSVTADRKLLRHATAMPFAIRSEQDWFELRSGLKYLNASGEEEIIELPAILQAARDGQTMIALSDGSQGILPEDWLKQHGLLAQIGQIQDDHLRFKKTQAALLDTLLAEHELTQVDQPFEAARQRLRHFQGVHAISPTPQFAGELRPYQREGLGWLEFLRWLGMGGILADDMGLGKTIQVLAMLDHYYSNPASDSPTKPGDSPASTESEKLPSLIVVPRSVVFNWLDEATRFTPHLRVQSYTGTDRHTLRQAFGDHEVIVTSYGLMRRDIAELRQQKFHYVILDEAQAIKNPSSQSARSARLLQANHRLALTGTPIENHLGDLWSIFDFLNHGMLGTTTTFNQLLRSPGNPTPAPGSPAPGSPHFASVGPPGTPSENADLACDLANADLAEPIPLGVRNMPGQSVTEQLAKALRPFILRRTKKQVLQELPDKIEQTILCQMEPAQRQIYDELLRHYRGSLLHSITPNSPVGMGKQTIMVLEALLRLRQAACHPGLIDPKRNDEPSAKLDVLLERITDLIDEGHKALVFSQFTSMLNLVRQRLDKQGIVYEYLDGQTRNRKQHVERFQTDPACPLFLISLKAGGLGLNLTAAEYVFILDPWWNPAVEAQAIDRAHRIGQTRHVFAYRLICQDTVEQRIADLQQKKKHLADAIIGGQENLRRNLTREDLELLLS